jgi:hypothetical protein
VGRTSCYSHARSTAYHTAQHEQYESDSVILASVVERVLGFFTTNEALYPDNPRFLLRTLDFIFIPAFLAHRLTAAGAGSAGFTRQACSTSIARHLNNSVA